MICISSYFPARILRTLMRKILLIDDESGLVEELKILLTENGFSVCSASNGREGVSLFHVFLPDLVITDILMPEQEGIETILELKKASPDLRIIAISGGGLVEATDYLKLALQVGADASLQKPFKFDELLTCIDTFIPEVKSDL